MKFQELIILLPCHSLEDFPQHHEGEEAAGLLANWTALWHPALIAGAGAAPKWHRIDDPPAELSNRLVLVPSVSADQLPTGFAERAKESGACLIRQLQDRQEIIRQAFEHADELASGIDESLVSDFLALGYCFLQVQLLTRQMRYSSNLDELHFNDQLVAGAVAAAAGDMQLANDKLTACFGLLGEERDHYYSVDAFLIDLTMVAEQTLGAALLSELTQGSPINLLMPGELCARLAEHESDTHAALAKALADGNAGLISGENVERRLPLLSCETILAELRRGTNAWQTSFGRTAEVYGRRRFGLTPLLPQVLEKFGFKGSLHATMDDGRFPLGTQIKTRWEGPDGAALDALARAPLDASKPETFLNLATKLGESMDMDHVATLMFAHWPGHASVWYEDLRRSARYGSAFGKFVTVDAYFRDTYMPGHLDRFETDQYRSPYLKQSIIRAEADPLSTIQRYWQRNTSLGVAESLSVLAALVQGTQTPVDGDDLRLAVDRASDDPDAAEVDKQLSNRLAGATEAFAACIPHSDGAKEAGYLVMNPFSFVRRVGVEMPKLSALPKIEKPIYAAAESATTKHVVVDVPPMGFVWVTPATSTSKQRPSPLLAEDLRGRDDLVVIRNEFLEATINPTTGAMQSLKDYGKRGNRLSQQLGLRAAASRGKVGQAWQDPDAGAEYSVMAADSVDVTTATTAYGEVVVSGRLLDRAGKLQAKYREKFRLWRGTRVLHLEIELDPAIEPAADPWNAYYACRFAWADETAELFRAVNQTRQKANRKQLEAPLYVEINTGEMQTTILTGGWPYHKRIGDRMLDTMLSVRGERQRKFHLGLGVDLPQPHNEALGLLAPTTLAYQTASAPQSGDSSWLFHIDARNVVATHWEPISEGDAIVGARVRMLETSGRAARARLSAFRPVRSARTMNFTGESRGECQLNEGRIQLEFSPSEWIELEILWSA
ncbi:MAG: hypothetical protein O3C40_34585 [Planctomycetota bacterium]|nr:hypothetical protein [Planctomycetota bacterium]